MKNMLSILIFLFTSLIAFNQDPIPDTVNVTVTCETNFLYGKMGKVLNATTENFKDSLWCCGKGYRINGVRHYFIFSDIAGRLVSEGEYYHIYPDGEIVEHDTLGRVYRVGEYTYQGQYSHRKNGVKSIYQGGSRESGKWSYYRYNNESDLSGFIYLEIEYKSYGTKYKSRLLDSDGNSIKEDRFFKKLKGVKSKKLE